MTVNQLRTLYISLREVKQITENENSILAQSNPTAVKDVEGTGGKYLNGHRNLESTISCELILSIYLFTWN